MIRLISLSLASVGLAHLLCGPLAYAEIRDPTQAPRPAQPTASVANPTHTANRNFTLQMTLVSTEQRYAIINNRIVYEGETIGTAEVLAIEHSQVQLRDRQGAFTIEIAILPDNTRPGLWGTQ